MRSSMRIAVGGVSCALCLSLMLISAFLPFSTYAIPALAGIALIPAALEMGLSTAVTAYLAVSILSFTLVPDPEISMMFAFFFGYYPVLKQRLDRLRHRAVRLFAKLVLFNLSMLLSYWLMIHLFAMAAVAEELAGDFGWLLLVFGNACFWVYDIALRNITAFYFVRLRKVLFGSNRQ